MRRRPERGARNPVAGRRPDLNKEKNMKFLKLFLVGLMVHGMGQCSAYAASLSDTKAAAFDLNRASPGAMQKHALGSLVTEQKVWTLKAVYDFSKLGGAIGTVVLKGPDGLNAVLPKGAVIRDCLIDVVTAPTSGGSATIALGTGQSGTDLKSATAIASYTGLVACVPVGTAATAIKLTADRSPTATIATAALTAGKINVFIDYTLSE